jgi:hypothetical protein
MNKIIGDRCPSCGGALKHVLRSARAKNPTFCQVPSTNKCKRCGKRFAVYHADREWPQLPTLKQDQRCHQTSETGMETIFCEGGFYCRIPCYGTRYFTVWYPYTGRNDSKMEVHFPYFNAYESPKTTEEMKQYHKALGEFISLLENPPQYERNMNLTSP